MANVRRVLAMSDYEPSAQSRGPWSFAGSLQVQGGRRRNDKCLHINDGQEPLLGDFLFRLENFLAIREPILQNLMQLSIVIRDW